MTIIHCSNELMPAYDGRVFTSFLFASYAALRNMSNCRCTIRTGPVARLGRRSQGQFYFYRLYITCEHNVQACGPTCNYPLPAVFMCFVWISEQTAIISLYNINWLVFITETECVYCAVRTGYFYVILYI